MTLQHDDSLLDDIGWKLLQALQENARQSFRELGQRVGLSAPAVIERVRKLEGAGILIGYRAEIDLARVGLSIIAFIRMSTPRERSGYVGRQLQDIPEVLECHRVAGEDSFLMKVAVSSMSHLERLIDHLAQYGQSTTSIVLSSPVTSRIVEAEKD
ncbi:AsnC family transcriptional regulator [Ktedonobacter sp. SOSP1-52]|uniref:Lrp/AsnC family transcriptional regulator n=1 Tax=Ktedonobacter sp. SOSP1-52 TaxID=2778366 RepID=UPI001916BB58|nr:Lrp/AsnC family transcriptional regulator [Ktedonobacter sp. SOSP1-52]GHO62761.1 AsnC family transcriptional regulator [Ktedonobacter sp. SOSP1-52]